MDETFTRSITRI